MKPPRTGAFGVPGRRDRDVLIAVLSLALLAQPGRPARACVTVAPPPAFVGFPANGSTDVPTDVIPVFDRLEARFYDEAGPGAVFGLTSQSGRSIALTVRRSHIWHVELVPRSPLEPRTRYTLEGRWPAAGIEPPGVTLRLSFTTGDGPLSAAPAPPRAKLQHYFLPDATCPSDCECREHQGTCIAVQPAGAFIEYAFAYAADFRSADDPYIGPERRYLTDRPYRYNLTGVEQGTSDRCVRLRVRAANGTYSQPVVLCREDGTRHELRGDASPACTADGLVTADGRLVGAAATADASAAGPADAGGPDASTAPAPAATAAPAVPDSTAGCSLAAAAPGAVSLVWPGVALLLALRRRRAVTRARRRAAA